jgi:hypothetical protein
MENPTLKRIQEMNNLKRKTLIEFRENANLVYIYNSLGHDYLKYLWEMDDLENYILLADVSILLDEINYLVNALEKQ